MNYQLWKDRFFHEIKEKTQREKQPFILGITGRVSVGKSTIAQAIQEDAQKSGLFSSVNICSTDHFLYSNEELEKRKIKDPRGFPQSYNRKRLKDFLSDIKAGKKVSHPIYAHTIYDILPGEMELFIPGELNIIEGVNLFYDEDLQLGLHSYYDRTIYLNTAEENTWKWYLNRVFYHISLCEDEDNFFYPFKKLPKEEIIRISKEYWDGLNRPNEEKYIAPTKVLADIIFQLNGNHEVEKIIENGGKHE